MAMFVVRRRENLYVENPVRSSERKIACARVQIQLIETEILGMAAILQYFCLRNNTFMKLRQEGSLAQVLISPNRVHAAHVRLRTSTVRVRNRPSSTRVVDGDRKL
jgi:hypothetical protein